MDEFVIARRGEALFGLVTQCSSWLEWMARCHLIKCSRRVHANVVGEIVDRSLAHWRVSVNVMF